MGSSCRHYKLQSNHWLAEAMYAHVLFAGALAGLSLTLWGCGPEDVKVPTCDWSIKRNVIGDFAELKGTFTYNDDAGEGSNSTGKVCCDALSRTYREKPIVYLDMDFCPNGFVGESCGDLEPASLKSLCPVMTV